MVLIFSEISDHSTNHVIEWIVGMGYPFYRVNDGDTVEIISLGLDDFKLRINGNKIISYSEIDSTWFRRGEISIKISNPVNDKSTFSYYLQSHLRKEQESYVQFIYKLLHKKRYLGSINRYHINKFEVLSRARACGLRIPDTFFVSDRESLRKLLISKSSLIAKSSNYVLNFNYKICKLYDLY